MRIHRHFRQAKARAMAAIAVCLLAAVLTPVASAEPALDNAASCGSVGSAIDSAGGNGPGPTGPVDGSSVATNGSVGQVAENSTYDDAALKILDEHTELLRQSDVTDPTIVEGKLESDCGVAFILEGADKQIGAVGITGLQINENSRWLVQGLEGSRGYRMMAVLENAQAPKSYTVKLELDQDISVVSLDNGGAVFVNNDNLVIGSILAPWALDSKGQSVPIVQTVATTGITITVDTSSVTAWPVIADPTYHTFRCYSQHQVTTTATASQYLNGHKCPRYADIITRGYYPQWIEHWNRWRVGKANGDCSWIPERLDVWTREGVEEVLTILEITTTTPIPRIPGVVYDFHQACQGHDYCYDLGHSDRLNYTNVDRLDCDNIMRSDMLHDCPNRRFHVRWLCRLIANGAYKAVRSGGSF
ncbi:MAG: hypothetical protein F4Y28_16365 [Acidimicrobiia bacterium]|nr:hypothetical protein [Acidimicrobiia bacterium]